MTAVGEKTKWLDSIDYQLGERIVAVPYSIALKKNEGDNPFAAEVKIQIRKPDEIHDEIEYWEAELRDIQFGSAIRIQGSARTKPKNIRFLIVQMDDQCVEHSR